MWDEYKNISDELLAAFLDGNTDFAETKQVLNALANDSEMAELVAEVYAMDEIDTILQQDSDFSDWKYGIEPAASGDESDIIAGCAFEESSNDPVWDSNENFFISDDRFSLPSDSILPDDDFNHSDDIDII